MSQEISQIKKYEQKNQWDEALEGYMKLGEKYPENIDYKEKIAWCLSRLRKYDEAINTLEQIIKIKPNSAKVYYQIGYQYYMKQDWDKSIEWFEKSLDIYPKYLKAKYRLGYALTQVCGSKFKLKKSEYLKAFKHFKECIEIWEEMPKSFKKSNQKLLGKIYFQKGKIHLQRQEWDEAIFSFKRAVNIDNKSNDYKYNLAKAFVKVGKLKEALEIISNLEEKYYIKELKAEILFHMEQYDQSLQQYLDLIKKRKKDYLYRQITLLYLKKGNYVKAHEFGEKSVYLGRDNHKNYYILGQVFYNMGLLINAKKNLIKAIEIKKEKYNSKYLNAEQLLDMILNKISENRIEEDDKEMLKKLNQNTERTGTIIKYFSTKGYGFIKDINNEKQTYFFHISDVKINSNQKIEKGQFVAFNVKENNEGSAAKEIHIL